MSVAFVRGGVGEVDVKTLPALKGRGFYTQSDAEAAASAYEAANPNAVVRRNWESSEQHAERLAGRDVVASAPPTVGMDPERASKELRRVYANIYGLDPKHPEYERLWANWTEQAHQLERICGVKASKFQKGMRPRKADDPIDPELQKLVNSYSKLHPTKRREAIVGLKNPELARLIRDFEVIPELQSLAIERLAQLGAL